MGEESDDKGTCGEQSDVVLRRPPGVPWAVHSQFDDEINEVASTVDAPGNLSNFDHDFGLNEIPSSLAP